MNPDISEIIKVSLKIVKYIMFYVPRTLLLDELFGIINEINKSQRLFFDIHILKSANKIKALLIIFGYEINKKIQENDIEEYLKYIYENWNLNDICIKMISAIAKTIGNYRFFENEINFRKNIDEDLKNNKNEKIGNDPNFNMGKQLFKYFFDNILTNQEKIKLKSLKIYSQFKALNNKNNDNKNTQNSNHININNINNIIENNNIINNYFLDKYTVEYTGDNNDVYIKMKEEMIKEKAEENRKKTMIIQNNKNLKLSPKKINYYYNNNFKTDDENNKNYKKQISPTNTISTSLSPLANAKNIMNPSISAKNDKNRDRILTPCHEINLSFIIKK